MKNKYFENGELKDNEICTALIKAEKDFKNGEILEVMDELQKIINAIKKFERFSY
jgi:hypothetical protein